MSDWNFDPPEGIQDREAGLAAVLKKLRYDLTAAQAKLSETLRIVATLDLPENAGERTPCPVCGVPLLGPRTTAEHMYASHAGPVPEHYLEIDARSLDPDEPLIDP